jgi:hypothetical protein
VPLEASAPKRLWILVANSALIAVFLAIAALLIRFAHVSASILVWPLGALMVPVLLQPVGLGKMCWLAGNEVSPQTELVVQQEPESDAGVELVESSSSSSSASSSSSPAVADEPPQSVALEKEPKEVAAIDVSGAAAMRVALLQVIRDVDFWVLFVVHMLAIGPSIAVQQSIAELCISRASYNSTFLLTPESFNSTFDSTVPVLTHAELPNSTTAALIPLYSVFSAFGRLFAGMMVDRFQHTATPVTLLFIPLSCITVAISVFSFANLDVLFPATALLAFGYGQVWLLMPLICSDDYGAEKLGVSWGLAAMAPAVASLASNALAGALDDHFSHETFVFVESSEPGADPVRHCVGDHCFQYAYVVFVGALLIGVAANAWLWFRRRKHQPPAAAGAR